MIYTEHNGKVVHVKNPRSGGGHISLTHVDIGPDDATTITIIGPRGGVKALTRVDASDFRKALILAGIGKAA